MNGHNIYFLLYFTEYKEMGTQVYIWNFHSLFFLYSINLKTISMISQNIYCIQQKFGQPLNKDFNVSTFIVYATTVSGLTSSSITWSRSRLTLSFCSSTHSILAFHLHSLLHKCKKAVWLKTNAHVKEGRTRESRSGSLLLSIIS